MAEFTGYLDEEVITDRHCSAAMALQRAKLEQRVLGKGSVPLTQFRVWDALNTLLPGTSATDDLGLYGGTYGSSPPYIGTSDLKAAGATTRYARALLQLPADYEAAQTVTLRIYGGMVTTVADVAATVDVEAWRIDKDGTLGAADLCATAAQSINNLTAAAKDFQITATTLTPGDILDVRLTVAVNDAATVTAVIAALWQVELMADLR